MDNGHTSVTPPNGKRWYDLELGELIKPGKTDLNKWTWWNNHWYLGPSLLTTGPSCRDRMLVGITTTFTISAYHH